MRLLSISLCACLALVAAAPLRAADATTPPTLAELAGPAIPDAQNAAILYQQAFAALKEAEAQGNGADPGAFVSGERRDAASWAEARQAVDRGARALALVEEAVARPACRFPVDWTAGFAATLPHLGQSRNLARYLCARALLDARDGKSADAARSLTRVLQVSEAVKDEPILISQLVRYAIVKMGTQTLRQVAAWCDLGADDRKMLADALSGIDLDAGLVRAMEGERAGGLWAYDKVRRQGFVGLNELVGAGGIDQQFWRLGLTVLWPPLLAADERAYLEAMETQIKLARLPWRLRGSADFRDETLPHSAVLARMLTPALNNLGKARDNAEAELAGSYLLLGLLTYREQQGACPESLRDLRIQLRWRTPPDPFTGADLVYRRVGEGFLLYSIGDDLKDDGGKPLPRLAHALGTPPIETGAGAAPPAGEENRGDLVWCRAR